MQKLLLAFLLGLFQAPEPPAAPATAPEADRPALVEVAAREPDYSSPPADPAAVAAARSAVRYEREGDTHRFRFPDGTEVEFEDRPRRGREPARRARVVAYAGTESAAEEPEATFAAAGETFGLSPAAVAALRYVSRHEGGFDAINTWDSARFSWGFIQFAGGYGLRPALAHLKGRSPLLFHELLGRYGVDVLPDADGEPVPVYVDPDTGRILRGKAAEQAYGDDPLVIALFIRAGREPEVKQRQIEAAIRDYAAPALTETYNGVRLSDVLRSAKGLAMLIDRKVHEGNVVRLEWALEHAWISRNLPNPADWPRLEGEVLRLAVQDADARATIAELAERARFLLGRARSACLAGLAERVPDGPSLTEAREVLRAAIEQADQRMVVSYRRDRTRRQLADALEAIEPERARRLGAGGLRAALDDAAARVSGIAARFRYEGVIRRRLAGILASDLPGPAPSL